MGQSDQILSYLKSGKTLTFLSALELFGCARIGARCWELRELKNYPIKSRTIKLPNGKRVAEYYYDYSEEKIEFITE